MKQIIVALPAYNEETALPKLLDKLILLEKHYSPFFTVVVVNDGSTDKTSNILKHYFESHSFIHVISHEENKGLGAAMQTLFNYILSKFNDCDLIITLDADNTHNPKIIPSLIHKLANERLDLVIASRFTEGAKELGLSYVRKIYSRGAKLFFKLFFPITGINDYSSGFRIYRLGYVRKVYKMYDGKVITTTGFECMVEILARFSKIGVRAGEFPLVLEYHLKETPSKMKAFQTIKGYFKLLQKVRKPYATVEKE